MLQISSMNGNFKTNLWCHGLNSLPVSVDVRPAEKQRCKEFVEKRNSLELADPNFEEGGLIEVIIGSCAFWNCLQQGKIHLGDDLPIFYETLFGWVVAGPSADYSMSSLSLPSFVKIRDIDATLRKFWELQSCTSQKSDFTLDPCEQLFQKTTTRNSNGRFIMPG